VGRRKPLSADTLRASRAVPAAPATPAPIPTAPAPDAQPAFTIVGTQVVLYEEKLTKVKLYGTVARLADGRKRYRYLQPGRDGTPCAGFGDWSESDDLTVARAIPVDWPGKIRGLIESPSVIRNQLPPPDTLELDRFRAAWPVLAARLNIVPDAPPMQRFSSGPVFYPAASIGVSLCAEWWRPWVLKHCAGQWGLNGEWQAMTLSQDQLWTLDEQPMHIQNIAAVTTGSGAVLSRFVIPDSDQNLWEKPKYADRRTCKVIHMTTAFGRRGSQTVASIEELYACPTG
jgi:hypothetical protein